MSLLTISEEDSKSTELIDFIDPFNQEHVDKIVMWIRKDWNNNVVYEATVYFKSGNTSGTQEIERPDFPSLVKAVEAFIKAL